MAEVKSIRDLKQELETVIEVIVKKDDRYSEAIHKALEIEHAIGELKLKLKDSRDAEMKGPVVLDENDQESVVMESGEGMDDKCEARNRKHVLAYLLKKLPCSSATEDRVLMNEVWAITSKSPAARDLFGQIKWAVTNLLNPTSIQRSHSDASLQVVLLSILLIITWDNDNNKIKIVQEFPNAVDYLVRCLRSQRTETKRFAVAIVSRLSTVELNSKTIGDSGAIKPLVDLIKKGDRMALTYAGTAIRFLCDSVDENREQAVSEGAAGAVMEKIKSGILVDEMLETLVILSKDERTIVELEGGKGMLQCLFVILREDGEEKSKEHCMTIIHKMCHRTVARTRKIDEVENGRQTLESIASTGTKTAGEKACDLLLKLRLIDLVLTHAGS